MEKQIIEYTITYNNYKLKVLNIGATITEYSLDGHNVCLSYSDLESYRTNELFMGCIVGRTAGRIKDAKFGDHDLPHNYLEVHNHHGNGLHLAFYDVCVSDNQIILETTDPAGDYPGNAKIKVTYTLTDSGLTQEIIAESDAPTLFNFTNHSYFKLQDSVLDDMLQIDSSKYTHLDKQMFCLEDRPVTSSAFDFGHAKRIGDSFKQDDHGQFAITKFIDHPFKLDGSIVYSSERYNLKINSTSSYVVVYTANYGGDCQSKLANTEAADYMAICLETQERPGDLTPRTDYYSKTSYCLTRK